MGMLERLVHAIVVTTVLSLVVVLYNGTLFAWHPVLMSAGFLGFMAEGVLSALKFRRLEGQPRVAAIQVHLFLQAAATLCVTFGFVAIVRNKMLMGKQHFTTIHGKAGLATVIVAGLAPLGGILSFRKLGLIDWFPEFCHGAIKWAHRKVGLATWLLSLGTIQLALTHPAVNKGWLTTYWQFAVGALGLAVFAVGFTEPTGKLVPPREPAQTHRSSAQMQQRDEDQLAKTL